MNLNNALKLLELQGEKIRLQEEKISLLEGIIVSQQETIHELQELCDKQHAVLDKLTTS